MTRPVAWSGSLSAGFTALALLAAGAPALAQPSPPRTITASLITVIRFCDPTGRTCRDDARPVEVKVRLDAEGTVADLARDGRDPAGQPLGAWSVDPQGNASRWFMSRRNVLAHQLVGQDRVITTAFFMDGERCSVEQSAQSRVPTMSVSAVARGVSCSVSEERAGGATVP